MERKRFSYSIKSNGTRIDLDREALRRGDLKLAENGDGDQCEGCGRDILESGHFFQARTVVVCEQCGTTYPIERRS